MFWKLPSEMTAPCISLEHLTAEECERILAVVQRDLALFAHHKFTEIRRDDGQGVQEDETIAQQRLFNEKRCIRCYGHFTVLKEKITCEKCNFSICKKCAIRESSKKSWICKFCSSRESSPSPEWLQRKLLERCRVFESARRVRHLQKVFDQYDRDNDSGYDPSMSTASEDILGPGFSEPAIDPSVLEIHEHVEAIVEQIIKDPIDNTTLDPLCHNPEYDRMIEIYHGRLRDALSQLIQSIRLATNNQVLADDQTPTASHSMLKHIINEVIEESLELPYLGDSAAITPTTSINHHRDEDDDLENQSYEEILATVILNKIIEMYQKQRYLQRKSPDAVSHHVSNGIYEDNNNSRPESYTHSNKEIQTNMETDVESELTKSPMKSESSHRVTRSRTTMDFSEDESCSFGTESAGEEFSWAQHAERSPSLQYMVEEQIEEITTTFEEPGLEDTITTKRFNKQCCQATNETLLSQKYVPKHTVLPDLSYYYSGSEFAESRRVPFPEYGMDFIEGEEFDDNEAKGVTELMLISDRWEDNWLFKKKKSASVFRNMGNLFIGEQPISMLVPNPIEEVQAKIGNRDVDELSDMSEKLSNGSLELYQSDLESKDEECDGYREQDQNMGTNAPEVSQPTICDNGILSISAQRERYSDVPVSPPLMRHHVEKEALQNNMQCSSTDNSIVQVPTMEKMRPKSLQLNIPVPKPRKSKSSICSDREVPMTERRTPRFVPLASRKQAHNSQIRFSCLPESISVLAGRMARVTCQLSSPTTYNIAWFHGCVPLECGELYQFYSIGNNHILEIYDSQEMDGGTYSCLAYSESEETWADFMLSVVGSTSKNSCPHFKHHFTNCSVEEGRAAVLKCKILGMPEPQLILYKGDQLVQPSEHITMERKSYGDWVITINNTTLNDSGEYRALARNKVGETTSVSKVVVVPQGALEIMALTKKTNHVQNAVYLEAEDMVKSANKQTLANSIRQATGKALDIIVGVTSAQDNHKNIEQTSTTCDEFQVYRPDLIPGTIAEREHKKWQYPIDLPNNPYSPENIVKRIQRSESLTRSSLLPDGKPNAITPEEEFDEHTVVILDGPKKIDCGLKDIDPEKYSRDYYVHQIPSAPVNNRRRLNSGQLNNTKLALNDVEEKVYISTGRVLHLEDKIKNLESQVNTVEEKTSPVRVDNLEDKIARAVAQVTQSEKQVSRVEQEVARLQKQILEQQQHKKKLSSSCSSKSGGRVEEFDNSSSLSKLTKSRDLSTDVACTDASDNPVDVPLPSVKVLASKFNSPTLKSGLFPNGSYEHKEDGTTIVKIDTAKHHPTPKPRRSKLPDVPLCNSPIQESRDRLSFSSTGSSMSTDVPTEIFPITQSDLTNQNSNSEDVVDERPSVKELTQKFFEDSSDGTAQSGTGGTSIKRVHSLTARSLCKEFRDATQYHLPRQLNRKISINNDTEKNLVSIFTPPNLTHQPIVSAGISNSQINGNVNDTAMVSPDDGHGYTSDESNASTNSLSRNKPALKKLSRSIQNRAAFWDRRVKEERMSDPSMCEEFPPMEALD